MQFDTLGVASAAAVLGFTMLLISQVISITFYSECEKTDKFCSEALISDTGYRTKCLSPLANALNMAIRASNLGI